MPAASVAAMAEGRLSGKVAVVTGGASGIGLATVRRFVAEGARVMIGDVNGEAAASVAAELGPAVGARRCDVRNEADVEALFEAAVEAFGTPHIAFANAGIGSFAPIVDTDLEEWKRVVDVNLVGPLLTVKHAARRMRPGRVHRPHLEPQRRAALQRHERVLRLQGRSGHAGAGGRTRARSRGIRVNAVGPGLVRTPLTDAMWLLPAIVEDFDENAPLATRPQRRTWPVWSPFWPPTSRRRFRAPSN